MRTYQTKLLSGEESCAGVVERELSNIRKYNEEFNAFITILEEKAQSIARKLDNRLAKEKQNLPPLFGVPFGIKDNIFVEGFPTTAASGSFKDFISKTNADVVDSILESGAIPLGKTNLHELALGATSSSSYFGPVHNARDPSRISGGSSGGSAVAVALANTCLVSLGTDTGGSVRIPAALCGVFGFKPTIGLLSTEGVFPLSATLDHVGILASSIEDTIDVFSALRPNRQRMIQRKKQTRIRIGIPKNYFVDEMDKDVTAVFEKSLEKIRGREDLFSIAEGLDFGFCSICPPIRRKIQLREASWFYEEVLLSKKKRKLLQKDVRELLDAGLKVGEMGAMYSHLARFEFTFRMQSAMSDVDLLFMPTCPIVAPTLKKIIGNETGPYRKFFIRNTEPFNLTGFPALSIPVLNSLLPVGLQVVGGYGEDDLVLEAGRLISETLS